jgi:hypothetical protein
MINQWLPLASLVVAGLAVFIGPWIAARATVFQTRASLLAANKQIVAPMRQAWINSLRDRVADVLSTSWWYYTSGEDPTGPDEDGLAGSRVERRLRFVVQEIELMLNLTEDDHVALLEALNQTVNACYPGSDSSSNFPESHQLAGQVCRRVLKREWDRVKADLPYTVLEPRTDERGKLLRKPRLPAA